MILTEGVTEWFLWNSKKENKIRDNTVQIEGPAQAEAWKLRRGQGLGRGAVGSRYQQLFVRGGGKNWARVAGVANLKRVLNATQRTLDLTLWVTCCSQRLL